ncbi:MAG: NUDIX domain-containing protein [Fimbriimonadaceae bacterium]|nr:NUDIX domain-containing protein [Chitinophagales bacterium]
MARIKLPTLHSDFSVDCVIFGFDAGELKILLIDRNEPPYKKWKALPGNLAYDTEDIDEAAKRVLYELTGLKNVYLEQLYSFGKIDRHPQGRVITIAYYAIIKRSDNGLHPVTTFAKKAFWWPANSLPKLAFDHIEIAKKGIERIRNKIRYEPIGFELLPEQFTLTQLQHLYEAILETEIDKRNFRKKILSSELLIESKNKQKDVSHRAARLYKFNKIRYRELKKGGFVFKL